MKRNQIVNQIKTKVHFQNKAGFDEAELILYGDIGESFWSYGITASSVRYAMKRIESDVINVHIHSYGGDAFEGMAIYNIFKQSEKTINVYIDGIAASAASIIAMGADKIYMPRNTQLMIHNPQSGVWGYAEDLEKQAQALRGVGESVKQSYMNRFEGTEEELISYLDSEKYFTAEEAVGCGLADELMDYDAKIIEDDETVEETITDLSNKFAASVDPKKTKSKTEENPVQNLVKLLGGK